MMPWDGHSIDGPRPQAILPEHAMTKKRARLLLSYVDSALGNWRVHHKVAPLLSDPMQASTKVPSPVNSWRIVLFLAASEVFQHRKVCKSEDIQRFLSFMPYQPQ
jgi:hypothetical protein